MMSERGFVEMSGRYTVTEGYIVLDENSEVVDWFDTEDEAYSHIEKLENEDEN